MKLRTGILVPLFVVFMSNVSFSQAEIHSGVLHTQSDVEELNLLKLHCDALQDPHTATTIKTEFAKYVEIYSCDVDVTNNKLFVKFDSGISINYLLGILKRVSIDAYYMSNGAEVHYVKNPSDIFKF